MYTCCDLWGSQAYIFLSRASCLSEVKDTPRPTSSLLFSSLEEGPVAVAKPLNDDTGIVPRVEAMPAVHSESVDIKVLHYFFFRHRRRCQSVVGFGGNKP